MATYNKPPWYLARVINPLLTVAIQRLGFGRGKMAVLEVRKRKSGEWQRIPVNVLTYNGQRYLVSMRGESAWVRNARAAGSVRLATGGQATEVAVSEVPDSEKPPLLRAYLKAWPSQAKQFLAVSGPDAPDAEFARIAPDHPVFRLAG